MKRATILLADDHAIMIDGLRRILDGPEFEVVGVVADGRALLEAAARLKPEVIVADISMPLLNGIDAAREILKQNGRRKIVFLTMHPEIPYATAALAAGASGYVVKSSAGDELVTAIREALQGRIYVSRAIAKSVQDALELRRARVSGKIDGLTQRQREVLQLLAEGHQVKEIASALDISPKTAEFHKYQIMRALGVGTVAELTRYAVMRGIVN